MDLFVSEELRDGMIEKIIAQKHRPAVAKKAISKRQWYTSFMDELVKNACECFALCLYFLIRYSLASDVTHWQKMHWKKFCFGIGPESPRTFDVSGLPNGVQIVPPRMMPDTMIEELRVIIYVPASDNYLMRNMPRIPLI